MGLSAEKIILKYTDGKMAPEPEYYSGRGNKEGDLDSPLLEKIYQGVSIEHGAKAAKVFVNMVSALEKSGDVSASTFLVSFSRLGSSDWKNPTPASTVDAMAELTADSFRRGNTSAAEMGILTMMGGFSSNTSAHYITGDFLRNHQNELEGNNIPQKSDQTWEGKIRSLHSNNYER